MSPALERVLPAAIGVLVWGGPTAWLGWQVWLARRSRNWPSVTGRVEVSEVRRDPEAILGTARHHHVRYTFQVDGRTYHGRRVRFGGWLNTDPRSAGRIVDRYRAGQPVSVRYDPRNPARCTLERRVSRLVWLFLGIGLFMTGSVGGALLGWWN